VQKSRKVKKTIREKAETKSQKDNYCGGGHEGSMQKKPRKEKTRAECWESHAEDLIQKWARRDPGDPPSKSKVGKL